MLASWVADVICFSRRDSRMMRSLGLIAAALAGWALWANWRAPDVEIGPGKTPETGRMDKLLRLVEHLQERLERHLPPEDREPEGVAALSPRQREDLLEDCGPLLEEIRQELAGGWSAGGTTLLDRAAAAGRLARSAALYAECQLHNQRPDEACKTGLGVVELGRKLPGGGRVIEGLVGIALEAIGSRVVEQCISAMSEDGLAQAAEGLERLEPEIIPFGAFVRQEVGETAELRQEAFRRGGPVSRMAASFAIAFEQACGHEDLFRAFMDGLQILFTRKDRYIRQLMRCAHAAAETLDRYGELPTMRVPGVDLSMLPGCRLNFLRRDTVSALLRAQIAVRRFFLAHGECPARLEDAAEAFLPALPEDPFARESGAPLLYRREGDGYILYSRGPNGKDEGGKWVPWQHWMKGGDMVAGRIFEPGPDDLRTEQG